MKEFYITDDGIKLHAKLDMPENYAKGTKCPLAIVIHGLTGHMEERHIIAVAETMNSLGIATLRVEMYAHGKSEGTFKYHNLFKWLNNAMTVVRYARTLDFVTDLYICGHSQGGVTTVMIAGMMPDIFRAAIPLSPAVMITEGARNGFSLRESFDPCHIPDELRVDSERTVTGDYIRAAQMLDVDYAINQYKGPVLIVHGSEDEAVPLRCAKEAAEKYSNARLVVVEGDDHCFNYHLDQMLDAVRDFIEEVI